MRKKNWHLIAGKTMLRQLAGFPMILPETTDCYGGQSKYHGTDLEKTLALGERKEPLLVLKCKQQQTEDS